MKYVLMMHAPAGPYQIFGWSQSDFQAHIAFLHNLNQELKAAGEYVDVVALTAPDQATLVRAGHDGLPRTDGIFPESKEFLAGYWIVDVDSPERACAIAAKASAAPGPGGAPLNMPIEVRQVMGGSPDKSA